MSNNNQALSDKLKNLINVPTNDYCINAKSKSKHFDLTKYFSFQELISFMKNEENVLKFDGSQEIVKLYSLHKLATNVLKETGNWPLFFSRYFFQTKLSNGKTIFAPLLLKRLKIDKNFDTYSMYLADDDFVVNEKLLTFIEREWNVNLDELFQLDDKDANIDQYLDKLQVILNHKVHIISVDEDTSIFAEDDFFIVDTFIAGVYEPGGGKLKDDLLKIINEGIDPFDVKKIHGENYYREAELKEEPIFQISNNLNLYQKYAIRSALVEDTVIHGPPGTGKSEVIANIIANIIINNKNALVISEKKAALDVVLDRIQELKVLSLSLYDDEKNEFFNNIVKISDLLGTDWLSNNYQSKDLSFSIAEHTKAFSEYRNVQKFKQGICQYYEHFNRLSQKNNELNGELYQFWNLLNEFGINEYLKWKTQPFIKKMDGTIDSSISLDDFFQLIDFCNKYQLNVNETIYKDYFNFATLLKNEFKMQHLSAREFLKDISSNIYKIDEVLSSLVNEKDEWWKKLQSNHSYIDEINSNYHFILEKYQRTIDSKYFKVLDYANFKDFLIQLKKTTPIYKKTYVYEYLTTGKVIDKFSFFKRKFEVDEEAIKFYEELYECGYNFLPQTIIANIKCFKKLYVTSLINYQLLDRGMLEFLEQQINFDYEFNDIIFATSNEFNSHKLSKYLMIADKQNKLGFKNVEINNNLIDNFIHTKTQLALDPKQILDIYITKLRNDLASLNEESKHDFKELLRICHLKKRPSVFKVLEKYSKVLKVLFPIWFTRPDNAALFLPLSRGLFNYGIFDEASQMFLEKSFPLVYRTEIAIVAGDDKQLRPSSFFMSMQHEDEVEYDISDTNVAESLLEKAQASLWNTFILRNHYRSQSKDLIEFSNHYFYSDELIYGSINTVDNSQYGIEVYNTSGFFENGINKEEAKQVITLVNENILNYNKIVIITFNALQAKYIEKEMLKNNHPKILEKLEQGLLVITNLENVQGNEGDLVIISVSYAKKDENSKLHANFGPLINDGGSNRLNVAITRAKDKMIVVKSMYASEIPSNDNPNLLTFRSFIAFLDAKENSTPPNYTFIDDNSFAHYLHQLAKQYGMEVLCNYNIGSDNIDYCCTFKNEILCSFNFRKINAYDNNVSMHMDIDKNIFFNARKYNTHLIHEWEWLISNETVKKHLCEIFKAFNL